MTEMNPELGDSKELDSIHELPYQEHIVPTFREAVDRAIEYSYIERENGNIVSLVDIDGCLIEDDRMKTPFLSYLHEPIISDENKESLLKLVTSFGGSVGIITNRGNKDNLLWNTGRVFGEVKGFLESGEINIEIYKSLLRQFPFLKRGDTEKLIEYFGEKVVHSKDKVINVYAMEDFSIVSPNRGIFYNYIGKEIRERYGGVLRVKNFVIKR